LGKGVRVGKRSDFHKGVRLLFQPTPFPALSFSNVPESDIKTGIEATTLPIP
jgi:hypothetical protein